MRKISTVLLSAALLFSLTNAAMAEPSNSGLQQGIDSSFQENEVQKTSDFIDQEPSFFDVNGNITDSVKGKGKNRDIKLTMNVKKLRESDKDIELSYVLSRLSDDKYGLIEIENKTLATGKKLKLNELLNNNLTVSNLAPGQYELMLNVKSKQSDDETWGGRKQILFTVTDSGITNGWSEGVPNYAPATSSDPGVAPYIQHTSKDYKEAANDTIDQVANSLSGITPLATVTLSGNWAYTSPSGSSRSVRNAKVEVKYRDQFYIWRSLATTYTDGAGNWSISYTPPTANYWEIDVYTQNTFSNVKDTSGNTFYSNIFYLDLTTGGNVNNAIPSSTNLQKATWIYDDIVTLRTFLNFYKDPGNANNVVFDAVNDQISQTSSSGIYLYSKTPGTSTVMHEYAHNVMLNLYGSFPPAACDSPHYIDKKSEPGCAWNEGWADFLPLIFSNGIYTYSGGTSTTNFENTSSFGAGISGDDVEGRVTGALWDLYDSANDGFDTYYYPFSSIYQAMWDGGKKNNLSAFWAKWKALGFDSNAKNCFKQNGITYS